jgi:hypothetical protein
MPIMVNPGVVLMGIFFKTFGRQIRNSSNQSSVKKLRSSSLGRAEQLTVLTPVFYKHS